jgi:ribonuclease HI
MQARSPHFLLFSEAVGETNRRCRWRFVLQPIGGQQHLAAEDSEPGTSESRLELLAVVRGLEALDQPSRVTLVTHSRYVARGIRRGLTQWRARRWRWERFGQLVPIRDYDLWQRVDQAMRFHDIDCCGWHSDEVSDSPFIDAAVEIAATARESMPDPVAIPEAGQSGQEVKVAACQAMDSASEPALLLVRRNSRRRQPNRGAYDSSVVKALERLRQNVLAPLAAICRPAFTRAA